MNLSVHVQRRRKIFLVRGAGLLNVLREAQKCRQRLNWLGWSGGMAPRKIFEKLLLWDQFWCNLNRFTLHCTENDCLAFSGVYPHEIV